MAKQMSLQTKNGLKVYISIKKGEKKQEELSTSELELLPFVTNDSTLMGIISRYSPSELNFEEIVKKYEFMINFNETDKNMEPKKEDKVVKKKNPFIINYSTDVNGTEPMHTEYIKPARKPTSIGSLPIEPTRKTITPEEKAMNASSAPVGQMKKLKLGNNKLNQTGYANIVLMSIIVIIIVAIICVFIFL